jgi:hypothetical protein
MATHPPRTSRSRPSMGRPPRRGPARSARAPHGGPHQDRPAGPEQHATGNRLAAGQVAQRRMRQRRRRAVTLALLVLATALLGADLAHHGLGRLSPQPQRTLAAGGSGGQVAAAPAGSAPSAAKPAAASPAASYPATGPGTFGYAGGEGPTLGTAGTLRRFHVAVEEQTGQDATAFAGAVDAILGDQRGWTASRELRLQRVPKATSAEFTIFHATGATSEQLCATGGLHTERFTSCRLPGQVIINLARWLEAIPDYGAPLDVYQAYAINHEVGHQLGEGHQACPRGGWPAPVMQQQTYGLATCRANAWPYPDGQRYDGPPLP